MWLTGGNDFKLRRWSIHKGAGVLQTIDIHTDDITECVEIESPLCVATASLDRTIVMINIENPHQQRRIKDGHTTGIRHLRYQNCSISSMISIGNEIFANVWAPESLVSDIHVGKLQGHKKSIVDGNYLNKAPYFVTIDEINNVYFWDIHSL
jgi:WD40 repeat protein